MKVFVLADIGGVRDPGAERRVALVARRLRVHGHEVVVASHSPHVPGLDVPLTAALSMPAGQQSVARVRLLQNGELADEQLTAAEVAVLDALRGCDALYVCSCDLSSARGWLLYQTAATVALAKRVDLRVVTGSLALGPLVTRDDAPILHALLRQLDWTAVVDQPSEMIWAALGLPGRPNRGVDDVVAFAGPPAAGAASTASGPVVLCVSPAVYHHPSSTAVRAWAEVADGLAALTHTTVTLMPPARQEHGACIDTAFVEQIAIAMSADARVLRWRDPADLAAAVAGAAALVTTSDFAAVTGWMSGTPTIAVAVDNTDVTRLGSLANHWGAPEPLTLSDLVSGGAVSRLLREFPPSPPESRHVARAAASTATAVLTALEGHAPDLTAGVDDSAAPPAFSGQSQPRVAIITRTKDRPVLLARALDDVLAQTFTAWHHVVVNDGGERAAVDALVAARADCYAGRVTVLHHDRSRGMEAASDAGLAVSDEEFVTVHDDDDTWSPQFLARTVAYLDSPAGADDAGVVVRTEVIYEWLHGKHVLEEQREMFWPDLREALLADYLTLNRSVPISMLYRRAVHDSIGTYRADLAVVGDWEFNLRLLRSFSVGFLDGAPLAYWRRRRDIAGPSGNSVEAGWSDHRHHDALVRDEHLREWVARDGLGMPLLLAKLVADAVEPLNRRLEHIQSQLDELTATPTPPPQPLPPTPPPRRTLTSKLRAAAHRLRTLGR